MKKAVFPVAGFGMCFLPATKAMPKELLPIVDKPLIQYDEITLVSEGQSVYVPLGAKHRMENPGKLPMVPIEVQIGTYLGEDDIIRYDDLYSRN